MKKMVFILMGLILLICVGCEENLTEIKGVVAKPTFYPLDGTYSEPQTVTITSETEDVTIYYTIDGSEPSEYSILYSEPIEIARNTTLKAKAFKDGWGESETVKGEYSFLVATPVFDPPGGNYSEPQIVTISCETDSATIYYTTDGSEPTESSILCSEPIEIEYNRTLKAKAFKEGWNDSEEVKAVYGLQVATPTFKPPGGSYLEPQTITISCETEDAKIYYTNNGQDPTEFSNYYSQPLEVEENTILKAKAFKYGWTESETGEADYKLQVATPTFTPPGGNYSESQTVTINCVTEAATIRYTVDGSEPTESSTLYSESIKVTENTTLKAKAFITGSPDSDVAVADYVFKVLTPTFEPLGGVYLEPQRVTINCATEDATIHYTTDGSEPTQSSKYYKSPIEINQPTTLKAKAFKTGWNESGTIVGDYKFQVAVPYFEPSGGPYVEPQRVTISCSTEDATIRYTTDDSEPTQSSTLYNSPLEISQTTTLKAKAFRTGWTDSEIVFADYKFQVATPTFEPPGGPYVEPQRVTISCATEGATIRYTTDDSEPTESSKIYNEPVKIDKNTIMQAKSFKSGHPDSKIAKAEYEFQVETPSFNPPGGNYYKSQAVTINCVTEDVTIRYTTDDSEPVESSDLYTEPIEVTKATTLKARAFKTGWTESEMVKASYSIAMISMVYVPGGTFTMGRTKGTGLERELPVHNVTLDPFYISKYLVTQKEYKEIMGHNPAKDYGIGDNYPVYFVSWYSAIKFSNLLSIKEGLTPVYTIKGSTNPNDWGPVPTKKVDSDWDSVICNWNANGYRLPTEAEWEYAARGRRNTPDYLYSGSDNIDDVAWFFGNNSPDNDGTKPIGGKQPNGLEIYDMSGNLWDWCWDWYDSSYYSISPPSNPRGPASGSDRLRRGGGWSGDAVYCRVAYRDCSYPYYSGNFIGFRLCRAFP